MCMYMHIYISVCPIFWLQSYVLESAFNIPLSEWISVAMFTHLSQCFHSTSSICLLCVAQWSLVVRAT